MSTQPIQPTKTNFLDRALVLTERGIPVVPVPAREKAAKLKGWPELATTNTDQLEVWNNQNPEQNTAAVAFAVPGGIWVLDCDVPNLRERIEAELGAKLPSTYTVKSSKGIHIYWKQTPRSIAMGNIPSAEVHDKLFDAQVHRKYVVGPGSIHPSGAMYAVIDDSPIVEAPDALIDWMLAQRKSQSADKPTIPAESAELQAKIDDMAGFLAHWGVSYELRGPDRINHDKHAAYFILSACPRNAAHVGTSAAIIVFKDGKYGYKCQHSDCIDVVENQPEPKKSAWALIREIIDPQREYKFKRPPMEFGDVYDWDGVSATVSTPVKSATPKAEAPKTSETPTPGAVNEAEEHEPGIVKLTASNIADMPEAVLDGRLGEICEKFLVHGEPACPRAYAWPALLGVGGTMYPAEEYTQGLTVGGRPQTNLFTMLAGPWGSGKSTVIEIAVQTLGMPHSLYSEIKAGSPETLVSILAKRGVGRQLLVNLDEWSHMLKKARIDGSVFYQMLQTAFYKDLIDLGVAGGKNRQIRCEMGFIGGIIDDDSYGELLGVDATGGFADRLLQGRCPSGFQFHYCTPEITPANIEFKPVRIDKSVWAVTGDWQNEFPGLGRAVEVAIRSARIAASADGRPVLYGKDLGPAKALMLEQMRIRRALAPNVGTNPDAVAANAILRALPEDGRWVYARELDREMHLSQRVGPGVFTRALDNLSKNESIEQFTPRTPADRQYAGLIGTPPRAGRPPKLVRRLVRG